MRSSTGQHFAALDHVRALAAFMVVCWHFVHNYNGTPVPFNRAPEIALLDEGHVGVGLFMTLSGYLFAKLIDGRSIDFPAFLWNRALRLLPLLIIVLIAVGVIDHRHDPMPYIRGISGGAVFPVLPNGGWSITAETHFYIILPVLLAAAARWRSSLLALIACAVAFRLGLFMLGYNVQDAAYWTIIGRLDQFVFGIYFFLQRDRVTTAVAAAALIGFLLLYAVFDISGGFYNLPFDWPWIFIPTLEGLAFGTMIAWYDAHPFRPDTPVMRFVQKAGEYSYSIYLLHFFVVFAAAHFVNGHLMHLPNIYLALPWAALFFALMVGVGHVSYKLIEEPPLRYRRNYVRAADSLLAPA
ncbi:MAG: acyltransferase [Sphingomicrobium sp.]